MPLVTRRKRPDTPYGRRKMMDEDIFLENIIWPWLADDSMADECEEIDFDIDAETDF